MTEGGTTQAAPIAHNGTIFLNNAANVLQAIDGKTGELIWENNYGTNATAAAMRGITIYDDKIILTTSDAHLMAFDARTGKTVWDTTIGNRANGVTYTASSGPLVVKGKVIQGITGNGCSTYREEKCFISAYDAGTGKLP
jgi:alcohol dehydrogenase (cytochrome c)